VSSASPAAATPGDLSPASGPVLTEADAQADLARTPRPDNPTAQATEDQRAAAAADHPALGHLQELRAKLAAKAAFTLGEFVSLLDKIETAIVSRL